MLAAAGFTSVLGRRHPGFALKVAAALVFSVRLGWQSAPYANPTLEVNVKPTICRTVVYREPGGPAVEATDVPAIITATPETNPLCKPGTVDLVVFTRNSTIHVQGVTQQPEPATGASAEQGRQELSPGCWRWPERS
jgi:hypothetical protein